MTNSVKWRSSQGFGLVEVIVAVVVVALIGAGVYLYMQQQEGGTAGLSNTQKETKTACAKVIDDELLCTAFAIWGDANKTDVTYTTTGKSPDGREQVMTMKMKGEDSHTVTTGDGEDHEMMSVAGVDYMKMDGVWYKFPASDTDVDMDDDNNAQVELDDLLDIDEADEAFEYKRLGEEACSLGTCVKYELMDDDGDVKTTTYMWVDKKSAKVTRMQMTQSDGSVWDNVMTYGPVTITAPANAKDFSEMGM